MEEDVFELGSEFLMLLIKVAILVLMVMVVVVVEVDLRMLFLPQVLRLHQLHQMRFRNRQISCLRSVFVSEFEWLITTSLFAQRRGLAQLRRASRLKALGGNSPSDVSR